MTYFRLCVLVLAAACSVSKVDREKATAVPVSATPASRQMGAWEVGTMYVIDVEISSALSFGADPALDFVVRGKAEVTPLSEKQSRVRFALKFRTVEAASLGKRDSQIEQVAADLRTREIYFDLEAGRLIEFRLGSGSSPIATQVLRQLAASFQLATLPGNSGTAEEFDTTGKYIAQYSPGPTPAVVNKRKLRYVSLLASGDSAAPAAIKLLPSVHESRGTVNLSSDGSAEQLDSDEILVIEGAQLPVRAKNKLHWRVLAKMRDPALAQSLSRSDDVPALSAGRSADRQDERVALDAARMGSSSFKEIVADIEQESAAPKANARLSGRSESPPNHRAGLSAQANVNRFVAMAAHLRQDPAALRLAVRKIQQNSIASTTLIDALGASGASASLSALSGLLHNSEITATNKTRILQALARTSRPDDSAVSAMNHVLSRDPYNPRALYALGTYSRHFRDSGRSEEAATLGRDLVQKLKRAPGPSGTIVALRAIANSGFSEAYAEVTAHLTAEDDATRVAAVRALQSMKENDVDGSLETRFHVDQSAEVRSAVLEVFRLRPVTGTVRRVAGEALSDVSAHVRYTALALVEHLMPEHPKLRPLVATVASNDPEAKIRLRATAILATDGVANTVIP